MVNQLTHFTMYHQKRSNTSNKVLVFFLFVTILFSCHNKSSEEQGQSGNSSKPNILYNFDKLGIRIIKDSMYIGEETCVKVFFKSNDKYELINGYIDCMIDSIRIDTMKKIYGCDKKLYIEEDTIKICLTPKVEQVDLNNIVILFSDKENNYYAADTSISLKSQVK